MRSKQVDPPLPQSFVLEVGVQVMRDLDDGDRRMQLREPLGSQRAGHGFSVARVHVDNEVVDV